MAEWPVIKRILITLAVPGYYLLWVLIISQTPHSWLISATEKPHHRGGSTNAWRLATAAAPGSLVAVFMVCAAGGIVYALGGGLIKWIFEPRKVRKDELG